VVSEPSARPDRGAGRWWGAGVLVQAVAFAFEGGHGDVVDESVDEGDDDHAEYDGLMGFAGAGWQPASGLIR
jgi:hypothetical protein